MRCEQLGREVQAGRRRGRRAGLRWRRRSGSARVGRGGCGCTAAAASRRARRARSSGSSAPSSSTWNVSPALVRAPTASTGRPSAASSTSPSRSRRAGRTSASHVRRSGLARLEQQDLGRAARRPPQPQAGRDDLRLVDDDDVAVAQQVGQVGDGAVLGRRAPPVDEQAGGVARLDRHLGDARRRQLVVELVEAHAERVRTAGRCASICARDDATRRAGGDRRRRHDGDAGVGARTPGAARRSC